MLRYFVIAAILVLGCAIVWTGLIDRSRPAVRPDLHIVRGKETPVPQEGGAGNAGARTDRPFVADAAWALSALPECLTQTLESRAKDAASVRKAIPRGAVPIVPPATLIYADCTIRVGTDDAMVLRGADRLHIPPHATFYRLGGKLILFHEDADGAQLRTYVASKP